MLCTPTPNGFADHYPYYINGYFIGGIPHFQTYPYIKAQQDVTFEQDLTANPTCQLNNQYHIYIYISQYVDE